jgi:hypothetical protein
MRIQASDDPTEIRQTARRSHEANRASREWTAVEKFKLKGLARQGYSAEKIARVLRRPVGTTIAVASKLGYRLISNELTDARDDMRLSD